MATQAQVTAFYNQMAPYALTAQQQTGINANLILAQWANETGDGTSPAFTKDFNPAGIGITGSGVTGKNYGSIQGGVEAYINFINDNPRYQAVKAAGENNPDAQAIALGNSGWAAGGYNDGSGPGSDLIKGMSNYTIPGTVAAAAVSGATASSGGAAANPGTTSNSTLATSSTSIGGVSYTGTQQQTSALSTIEANLGQYGFTPSQVSQLTNWAWGEVTNNVDPTQIAIDLQAQPAFTEAFPGFAGANAELQKSGLPAVSVQQYQQYQTQAQAMAQAAGLPSGFINSGNIGTLVGGNVSTAELSSRINNSLALAYQSTPEQQAQFNTYFGSQYGDSGQGGLTPGQIASIALDPSVAEPLIAQQIQTAQIGGAAVTSGVGAITKSTATQLAQAGVTTAQATSAFQNLAPYSSLETARPGEGAEAKQGVVSSDQLATGQLLGNPAAQRQLQTAVEVAKAPFAGGGGFVGNSKGDVGAGSASSSGAGSN